MPSHRLAPLPVVLACLLAGCGDPPPERGASATPGATESPVVAAPAAPPAAAPATAAPAVAAAAPAPVTAAKPAPEAKPTPATAAKPKAVPKPAASEHATSKRLFDFEKGTQGWYAFSHEATLTLTHGDDGAAGSAHSLAAEFAPGKGGYLGMGVVIMGKTAWSDFAGGHLVISARSDNGTGLSIAIDTGDKARFGMRIRSTTAEWTTYRIPLASFTGGQGRLDLATSGIARITVTPGGKNGKTAHLWLDDIGLSNQPVELPSRDYEVAATARDSAGAPLAGVALRLVRTADGLELASGTSDASGACVLHATNALADYVTADAGDDAASGTDLPVQLRGEHDGMLPALTPAILQPGAGAIAIALRQPAAPPQPLHVDGNRLRDPAGAEVWLQGLCIDSMEWSAGGERIMTSVPVAIDLWKANLVRLPVKGSFWFGKGEYQKDGGESYRKLVDAVRDECVKRGARLALDLHGFGAPTAADAEFWKDASTRYKNDPAVIFELFNEPHDIPWEVWRDGGDLDKAKHDDQQVVQNTVKTEDKRCIGMQALVDAIRATGAKNLIAAGGLGWSYDLSGVTKGFALKDTADGQGIMYVWHTYPWSHWKVGWQKAVLDAAAQYPILVSEVGNIRRWEDFPFIKQGERVEDITTGDWPRDILGLIQTHRLNWTGFSFHVTCGPPAISDWSYTPNDYWGVYVKRALAGEKFELKRVR